MGQGRTEGRTGGSNWRGWSGKVGHSGNRVGHSGGNEVRHGMYEVGWGDIREGAKSFGPTLCSSAPRPPAFD